MRERERERERDAERSANVRERADFGRTHPPRRVGSVERVESELRMLRRSSVSYDVNYFILKWKSQGSDVTTRLGT